MSDCGSVLVPIPDHMPEALAAFPDRNDAEYGRDEQGRACFLIDGCIVDALKAVWAAGYKTLGCCCGHGQAAGGIITIDNGTFWPKPRTGTQERYAAIHSKSVLDIPPVINASEKPIRLLLDGRYYTIPPHSYMEWPPTCAPDPPEWYE